MLAALPRLLLGVLAALAAALARLHAATLGLAFLGLLAALVGLLARGCRVGRLGGIGARSLVLPTLRSAARHLDGAATTRLARRLGRSGLLLGVRDRACWNDRAWPRQRRRPSCCPGRDVRWCGRQACPCPTAAAWPALRRRRRHRPAVRSKHVPKPRTPRTSDVRPPRVHRNRQAGRARASRPRCAATPLRAGRPNPPPSPYRPAFPPGRSSSAHGS